MLDRAFERVVLALLGFFHSAVEHLFLGPAMRRQFGSALLEKVASLFGVRGREDGLQECLNLAVIGLQCFQYRHDTSPVNHSLVGRRVKAALFGGHNAADSGMGGPFSAFNWPSVLACTASTTCSTACRNDTATRSAPVSVAAFRSSISFFFRAQNPATIVALGSLRLNRRTR